MNGEFVGIIAPGDGQRISNPIGGDMVVKLRDGMTHGTFSAHDNVLPAGSPGPRAHRHLFHDEVFYVLEGTLTVQIEDEVVDAGPGSFVVIPRGLAHQPSNRTADPVHVLLFFSPEGMDRFFVEAAAQHMPLMAIPDDPDVAEALDAFINGYGFQFADIPAFPAFPA